MNAALLTPVLLTTVLTTVTAHDWLRHDDPQFAALEPITLAEAEIIAEETEKFQLAAAAPAPAAPPDSPAKLIPARPAIDSSFTPFAPNVKTRSDARWYYVESDGLPAHNMMVGITAWQQQVPLPQPYTGENAWRIPLHPVPAKTPASIKNRFLRGAIALAANGIPIFNPQNNRGEVSQEIGELDQWGGHCGRADDYHYHAAPLHLQSVLGQSVPIAYALDGYAIYGLTEPDGSAPTKLDAFNGHETTSLGYHYHGSSKYPYVNGGFHGEVVEAGGQVDPQPRAQGVREAQRALRGARIIGFTNSPDLKSFALHYTMNGRPASVNYAATGERLWRFHYNNPDGTTQEERYQAGKRRGGRGGPNEERPPRSR